MASLPPLSFAVWNLNPLGQMTDMNDVYLDIGSPLPTVEGLLPVLPSRMKRKRKSDAADDGTLTFFPIPGGPISF